MVKVIRVYRGTDLNEALQSKTCGIHTSESLYAAMCFAFTSSGECGIHDMRRKELLMRANPYRRQSGKSFTGAILELDVPEDRIEWKHDTRTKNGGWTGNPYYEYEVTLKPRRVRDEILYPSLTHLCEFERKHLRRVHIVQVEQIADNRFRLKCVYSLDNNGKRVPTSFKPNKLVHEQGREPYSF